MPPSSESGLPPHSPLIGGGRGVPDPAMEPHSGTAYPAAGPRTMSKGRWICILTLGLVALLFLAIVLLATLGGGEQALEQEVELIERELKGGQPESTTTALPPPPETTTAKPCQEEDPNLRARQDKLLNEISKINHMLRRLNTDESNQLLASEMERTRKEEEAKERSEEELQETVERMVKSILADEDKLKEHLDTLDEDTKQEMQWLIEASKAKENEKRDDTESLTRNVEDDEKTEETTTSTEQSGPVYGASSGVVNDGWDDDDGADNDSTQEVDPSARAAQDNEETSSTTTTMTTTTKSPEAAALVANSPRSEDIDLRLDDPTISDFLTTPDIDEEGVNEIEWETKIPYSDKDEDGNILKLIPHNMQGLPEALPKTKEDSGDVDTRNQGDDGDDQKESTVKVVDKTPDEKIPAFGDILKTVQLLSGEAGAALQGKNTDGSTSGSTSYKLVPSNCTEENGGWLCLDGKTCVDLSERCNSRVDCPDNSDEIDCSCLDYLLLDERRKSYLCDEEFDCRNGEDERGCHGCDEDEFSCGPSSDKCIPQRNVCDNILDCTDGADERHCYALAPANQPIDDPYTAASPHNKGLLHWRVRGEQFHPISLHLAEGQNVRAYAKLLADNACGRIVPNSVAKKTKISLVDYEKVEDFMPETVAHLTVDSSLDDPDSILFGGVFDFNLAQMPRDGRLINVNCGEPVSGTRPVSLPITPQEEEATEDTLLADKNDYDFEFKPRIVGGDFAASKNWPSILGLFVDGKHTCGATVVDKNWVITAAHCVEDYRDSTTKPHYSVKAGLLRKSSQSPYTYSRTLTEIYIHERYNGSFFYNDIALAKVDEPFVFSARVSGVPLAKRLEESPRDGDVCFAAGWGRLSNGGNVSDGLMEAEIPIWSTCVEEYNDVETQICGGKPEGGVDTCQGDSGGPLYCKYKKEKKSDQYYLGGIVSHGKGCADPDSPGVYVRVYHYREWISSTMERATGLTKGERDQHKTLGECKLSCGDRCVMESKLCDMTVDCPAPGAEDELWCRYSSSEGKRVYVGLPDEESDDDDDDELTKNLDDDEEFKKEKLLSYHVMPLHTHKKCPDDQFKCHRVDECIPFLKTCDQIPDCKDGSDERGCSCLDYLTRKPYGRNLTCDSYPDCRKWGDEKACNFCPDQKDAFYCDRSKTCIHKKHVCDGTANCFFAEDEKYCMTLVTYDTVFVKEDGRPVVPSTGLVAVNQKGKWTPACFKSWSPAANDLICRYLGRRGEKSSGSYHLKSPHTYPGLKNRILDVRSLHEHPVVFPRRNKREAGDENPRSAAGHICSFVETTCSEKSSCGRMPVYTGATARPIQGDSIFPWQVTLYKNGDYLCGGTLVDKSWVLTSNKCSSQFDLVSQQDVVVARMGGSRDHFSLSALDQIRHVVLSMDVPSTSINLLMLSHPATLNDYVNTVCIPSVTWFSVRKPCYLTGKFGGALNHAYKTEIVRTCDYEDVNNYNICTSPNPPTNECLEGWSGALVCPDENGAFYGVGVYHSAKANCGLSDEPAPTVFEPIVTPVAREGIVQIIESAAHTPPYELPPCDTHRCPLGKCLLHDQVCDHNVDCRDFSDESTTMCDGRSQSCQQLNATHCTCAKGQIMCNTSGLCVGKEKYCDGYDDCTDGTDEPEDCKNCLVALNTVDKDRVCDSNVDCFDLQGGVDEGAETCCPSFGYPEDHTFRCVIGDFSTNSGTGGQSIPEKCIPREGLCDWNTNSSVPSCENEADELDCISIWPHKIYSTQYGWPQDQTKSIDAFGRFMTRSKGFLTFVAFGRKYLYCAGEKTWKSDVLLSYGHTLCRHEGFQQAVDVKPVDPPLRTFIGEEGGVVELPEEERTQNYERCKLVLVTCK